MKKKSDSRVQEQGKNSSEKKLFTYYMKGWGLSKEDISLKKKGEGGRVERAENTKEEQIRGGA